MLWHCHTPSYTPLHAHTLLHSIAYLCTLLHSLTCSDISLHTLTLHRTPLHTLSLPCMLLHSLVHLLTLPRTPSYALTLLACSYTSLHTLTHSYSLSQALTHFPTTFSSVQFSHSVVSDSLRPHESQHARPPCPSPTPGVHSDSHPSSRWCHPAISSSVVPFFSWPQSLPASESFPISQLFAWGGQSTGVSALASFLPRKSQGWSPLEWTSWISWHNAPLKKILGKTKLNYP